MTDRDPENPRESDRTEEPSVEGPAESTGDDGGDLEVAPESTGDDGADVEGVPEVPPPSTWAGRRLRAEGDEEVADEEEADADAVVDALDEPGEPPGKEQKEVPDEEGDEEPTEDAEHFDEGTEIDEDGSDLVADTVEADTPALADREATREAALAGVRARAAEHAAKQGTGEAAVDGAPAATVEPQPPAETEAPEAESASESEETPPSEAIAPPAAAEVDEGPPGRGVWPRFVAGSLLICVSMATATAVSLLVYLTDFARGLGGLPSVRSQLQVADPGNPQTILILGSDKRPQGQEVAHSDTAILLRVATDQITVLSIPRDLRVNIKGYGVGKFNEAYTDGGPKLTLTTVKQLTGLEDINHVVNVNFTGFADAVNAIGCVYVDVDHHYYHSNLGLAAEAKYAEIDIPAGYQRMCGLKALQYVRYRHEDNDLVRSARQQEFLRETRQELPPSELLSQRNTLIDILKKYVTSDIEHPETIIGLGKLFLAARNAPVVQVHFPANLGGANAVYVTASRASIKQAVAKFEGETPAAPIPPEQPAGGGSKKGGANGQPATPAPPPLIDSSASGQQYAANVAATKTKSGKPMLDFPVYYPTKVAPSSTLTDDSRAFPIDGPGDDEFRGYKIVASIPSDGYTAYYGFSGTDWKDPPILANPDETKDIDGRDYLLSWDGGQLRLVGWKTKQASYWIDNTLLNALTPGQMLAIAQSMQAYTG